MELEVVTDEALLIALHKPFLEKDIEWRIQSSGFKNTRPWIKVLAYVTNRAVMDRLDHVFGIGGWQNEFKAGPQGGVICGISAKINGEWVIKWDGAENTQVEEIKGGLSASMKRSAVQWGIGRYLYDLDISWAEIGEGGKHSAFVKDKDTGQGRWVKWSPPRLPAWALPRESEEGLMEKKFTDLINRIPESKRGDWYTAWKSEKTPAGKARILSDFNSFFNKAGFNG